MGDIQKFKENLRDFFLLELEEIKQNKMRIAILTVCVFCSLLLMLAEDNSGEEISLTENPETKVEVSEKSVAKKIADEKIKTVIGSNSAELKIANPFEIVREVKIPPAPVQNLPPPEIFAENFTQEISSSVQFFLTGIARGEGGTFATVTKITKTDKKISDEKSFYVTAGEFIDGRKVLNIGNNFLQFEDGEKIFVGN